MKRNFVNMLNLRNYILSKVQRNFNHAHFIKSTQYLKEIFLNSNGSVIIKKGQLENFTKKIKKFNIIRISAIILQ